MVVHRLDTRSTLLPPEAPKHPKFQDQEEELSLAARTPKLAYKKMPILEGTKLVKRLKQYTKLEVKNERLEANVRMPRKKLMRIP